MLFSQSHQARHFNFRDLDFLTAEIGEFNIGHLVRKGGHGAHEFILTLNNVAKHKLAEHAEPLNSGEFNTQSSFRQPEQTATGQTATGQTVAEKQAGHLRHGIVAALGLGRFPYPRTIEKLTGQKQYGPIGTWYFRTLNRVFCGLFAILTRSCGPIGLILASVVADGNLGPGDWKSTEFRRRG